MRSVNFSCRGMIHVDGLILIGCDDHTLKCCLAGHCDVWDLKFFVIMLPVLQVSHIMASVSFWKFVTIKKNKNVFLLSAVLIF